MNLCLICNQPCKKNRQYCSVQCSGASRKGTRTGYASQVYLGRPLCTECGQPCKRATTKTCSFECAGKQKTRKGVGGKLSEEAKTKRRETIRKYKETTNPDGSIGLLTMDTPRECPTCKISFLPKDKPQQKYCSYKCSANHPDILKMKSEQAKNRKGVKHSPEARANMSVGASNRKASTNYTKGIGGTRDDIGHYVRSSWEANFCRIFNYAKLPYVFEPDRFSLQKSDGTVITYTPDFKVNGKYIEVKGWWTEKALLCKELMAQQYPEIVITYIGEPEYKVLEQLYQPVIPNWETKHGSRRK